MKKIISIILAITLLAVPFYLVNVFAEETSADDYIGTEIIKNGGFDNPLSTSDSTTTWKYSWGSNDGRQKIVSAGDYAGSKKGDSCLELQNFSGGVNQSVSLKGGYIYKLSFLYSSGYGKQPNKIYVNFKPMLDKQVFTTTNFNYELITYTFECKEDLNTSIRFYTDGVGANDYYQHIDDVSLVATQTLEDYYASYYSNELVTNGDFSNGTNGWTKSSVSVQDYPTDTSVKELFFWHGGNGYAATDIIVEAGKTYDVSFTYRKGNTAPLNYSVIQNGETIFEGAIAKENSKNVHTEASFKFTAVSDGVAQLKFASNPQDTLTCISNVSAVPAVNSAYYGNAVVNGTFEANVVSADVVDYMDAVPDFYGWALDGTASIDTDIYANGAKALKVAGDTDGAYARFNVANPENTLAFNYMGEADSSAKVIVSSDFAGENVIVTKDVIGTGDWTQVVVPANIAVGDAYIHIVSNQGTNYFDDVSVISYGLIANADFAPKADDNYFYNVAGADIKAGYEAINADLTVSSDEMATGVKVALKINGKFTAWEKEIVVEGDANGDGISSIIDLVVAYKQATGMNRLSGAYLRAVTANENGEVQEADIINLRRSLLNS